MELRVAEVRNGFGMTQEELARQIGVKGQTVSNWETGRTDISSKNIREMCRLFGCTPNDLLGWETGAPSPADEEHLRKWNALAPADRAALSALIDALQIRGGGGSILTPAA